MESVFFHLFVCIAISILEIVLLSTTICWSIFIYKQRNLKESDKQKRNSVYFYSIDIQFCSVEIFYMQILYTWILHVFGLFFIHRKTRGTFQFTYSLSDSQIHEKTFSSNIRNLVYIGQIIEMTAILISIVAVIPCVFTLNTPSRKRYAKCLFF